MLKKIAMRHSKLEPAGENFLIIITTRHLVSVKDLGAVASAEIFLTEKAAKKNALKLLQTVQEAINVSK